MDPGETLRMIRVYVHRIDALRDAADLHDAATVRRITETETLEDMTYALAEYVTALDEWLSKGGFLPKGWQHS